MPIKEQNMHSVSQKSKSINVVGVFNILYYIKITLLKENMIEEVSLLSTITSKATMNIKKLFF